MDTLQSYTALASSGLILLAFANIAMAQDPIAVPQKSLSVPAATNTNLSSVAPPPETRGTPLVVNVPSLPTDAPAAQVVDKTLPVQLMDVQLSDVFQPAAPAKTSTKTAAAPPSKRVVIGQTNKASAKVVTGVSAEPSPVKITFGDTAATPDASAAVSLHRKPHWSTTPVATRLPASAADATTDVSFQPPYVAPTLVAAPVSNAPYVAPALVAAPATMAVMPAQYRPATTKASFRIDPPLSVASFTAALAALGSVPLSEKTSDETTYVAPQIMPPVTETPSAMQVSALAPAALANLAPAAGDSTPTPPAPLVATAASEALPEPVTASTPAETTTSPQAIEPQKVVDEAFKPSPLATATTAPRSQPTPKRLSKVSKKTLTKFPSGLDSPKPEKTEALEISREHKSNGALEAGGSQIEASHETLGLKIEVRKPTVDVNYELEKAYAAMAAGQPSIAIEMYKRAVDAAPENLQAKLGLAIAYHRAGRLDIARPLYAEILLKDPTNRDALNNFLGVMAEEAPDEALIKLQDLMVRNPDFSPIPAQMAIIYQKKGDLNSASGSMLKAVALAPENLAYKYNLAIIFDKLGRKEEASSIYSNLLDSYMRGENLGVNVKAIQERLTFLRSNR